MPGGDRTGPMGMGAMTGRALGHCAGGATPGYGASGFGRGRGLGYGRARGFGFRGFGGGGYGRRWGFGAAGRPWGMGAAVQPWGGVQPGPEAERQVLKSQADALKTELEWIQKRLESIETESQPKP